MIATIEMTTTQHTAGHRSLYEVTGDIKDINTLLVPRTALATPAQAAAPDMTDAYSGAREDLSIWKKRALEAEALNRKFAASVNSPSFMGEPAALAQAGEYPPLVCDYCGALTPDPWHSSGMLHGKMSKHIHSCDACAARGPADSELEDAARWREHVGKLDALVAYCPTCCQGFIAKQDMTRDEVLFACGKAVGQSGAKRLREALGQMRS